MTEAWIVAGCSLEGYHRAMLSDRLWWMKFLGCLACISVLGVSYTDFALHRPEGIRAARVDPTGHDGRWIDLPLWRVSGIAGPSRFTVSKTVPNVPIIGPTEGLSVGDTVSLSGVFRARDGVVLQTDRHLHWLRPWKAAFSLLGLLAAFVLGRRFFGWRSGRVVLRG